MRILVHDFSGHPFQAELSRELARRGHRVLHVHCASYVSGKGALSRGETDPPTLVMRAIDLGGTFAKHSWLRRLHQEWRYGRKLTKLAAEFRPDRVLSANTPLLAQLRAVTWCRRAHVGFFFWLQDIYSVGIREHLRRRLGLLGASIGLGFAAVEAAMLRRSEAVISISEDFLPTLVGWRVPAERMYVIENWAPLEEIPVLEHANTWSAEHGLAGRLVVAYAGTLGLKHDPEVLVSLAHALSSEMMGTLVVVSEGTGADYVRHRCAELGLRNWRVLDYQPYDCLPEVLATGDVLVTILERNAGTFSVPSKVLSYLCAGRPILAFVPEDNLAARIIRRSGAGVVVDPGDRPGLAAAALHLLQDSTLRAVLGKRARAYAEENFEIHRIADRFVAIMSTEPSQLVGAWRPIAYTLDDPFSEHASTGSIRDA